MQEHGLCFFAFMSSKQITKTQCHCDCGGTTKGGRYLPGHDAKHKKALLEAARGGSKRAATKLESLGWSKFLERALPKSSPTGGNAVPKKRGRKVAQLAS